MADGVLRRLVKVLFDQGSAKQVESQLEVSLKEGGKKGASAFLKELRSAFNARMTDLKLSLAKGLIDPAEFKRQTAQLAQDFNTTLIREIEKARKAGSITGQEFEQLAKSLKRVGDAGEQHIGGRLSGAFKTALAGAAAFFSLAAIKRFGQEAVSWATKVEESALRLRGVWEANAGAVARTFEEVLAFTREIRGTTLFGREEIELATAQLLTYKSISGDTFERTIRLATNLSSVFGGLSQSTSAIAKALDDPIRGLGELRKQNFTFTLEVEQQIETLVKQGKLFEAQSVILAQLESEVGSVSNMMATDWVGAVDQYRKAWEDLKEGIGNALITSGNAESVLGTLTATLRTLTENAGRLVDLTFAFGKALVVGGVIAGVVRLTAAIRAANLATATWLATIRGGLVLMGPKGWFVLGVSGLTALFYGMSRAARESAAEASAALEEFKAGLVGLDAAALDAAERELKQREEALQARLAALREAPGRRVGIAGMGRDRGLQMVVTHTKEIAAAEAELNAIRAQGGAIAEERQRQEQAGALQTRLAKIAADAAAAANAKEQERSAKEEAKRAEQLARQFAERSADLEQEISDLGRLAAAHGQGAEAVAALERQLRAEGALRSAAKDLTEEQRAALEALIGTRDQEQSRLETLQRTAGLDREIDDLRRLREARAEGARAGEAMERQLRLEADIRAAVSGLTGEQARQIEMLTRSRQAERDAIEAQAEAERQRTILDDMAREIEITLRFAEAERQGEEAVRALSRELYIQQVLLQQGAEAGSEFAASLAEAAGQQWDLANQFVTPWEEALDSLREKVIGESGLFAQLGAAWADGSWDGLKRAAQGFVRDSLAQAVRQMALGVGSLFGFNPGKSAAHFKSAALHGSAAAAFRAIAGGGGGGAPAVGGAAPANLDAGAKATPVGPEVHVHFVGEGFDATNPVVQKVVFGSLQEFTERWPENTPVTVHRNRGG